MPREKVDQRSSERVWKVLGCTEALGYMYEGSVHRGILGELERTRSLELSFKF